MGILNLDDAPSHLKDFPRDCSTRLCIKSPPYREPYDNDDKIASSAKLATEVWIETKGPVDMNCFTLAVVDKMDEL